MQEKETHITAAQSPLQIVRYSIYIYTFILYKKYVPKGDIIN